MDKASEKSKRTIDEISRKAEKEINSLGKAQKEGIQLQLFGFMWKIEEMAGRIGVSLDALLMTFADLLLQAAIDKAEGNALDKLSRMAKEQENAELQDLAEKLVKASTDFEHGKRVRRKPPKGGYIQ